MPRLSAIFIVLMFASTGLADPPPIEPTHRGIELSIWLKNLESDQRYIRARAYESLMAMGPSAKPALPRIVAAMKRRSDWHTLEPVVALALRVDPEAAGPLVRELLATTNRHGKLQVSRDFFRDHSAAVRPHLTALLKNSEASIRAEAVQGLKELGVKAKEALPDLIAAAGDPLLAVRVEIFQTIELLDRTRLVDIVEPMIATMQEDGISVGRFTSSLRDHAGVAIPLLAKRLEQDDDSPRQNIALALAEFQQPAMPHLIAGLAHARPSVRLACALAMQQEPKGARDALPTLMLGLDDEQANVRLHCALAILAIDPSCEQLVAATLVSLLTCDDYQVQLATIQQLNDLKNLAQPAIPALIELLDANDRSLRLKVIKTLLRIDPKLAPITVKALVRSFQERGEWGRRSGDFNLATTLVGEVGPAAMPVLPYLVKYFRIENRGQRMASIAAALRVSAAAFHDAMPALREILRDSDSNPQQSNAMTEIARLGSAANLLHGDLLTLISTSDDSWKRLEAAVTAILVAPEESPAAFQFLRNELTAGGDRTDEALQLVPRLGDHAAPLTATLQTVARTGNGNRREQANKVLKRLGAPSN